MCKKKREEVTDPSSRPPLASSSPGAGTIDKGLEEDGVCPHKFVSLGQHFDLILRHLLASNIIIVSNITPNIICCCYCCVYFVLRFVSILVFKIACFSGQQEVLSSQ